MSTVPSVSDHLVSGALRGVTRLILPLTLLATALALLVPSSAVAGRSDVLLALLVLATALGIPWSELTALRSRAATVGVSVGRAAGRAGGVRVGARARLRLIHT